MYKSKSAQSSAGLEDAPPGAEVAADKRTLSLQLERECRKAVQTKTLPRKWEIKKAQERIKKLRIRMHERFVDRDEAIDGILAALISRVGCVLLGPPGTAKSMLVRAIADECRLRTDGDDANYFEYLLTAHTMPEEIFGPTDVAKLLAENPVVERKTLGRLPHAEIAFLDEVFRGGSHILNTLLTILNERKFHNGRTIEEVPLIGFVGAANHPPHTEELKAFFDRFPVRIWVDTVLAEGSGDGLMRTAVDLLAASGSTSSASQTGNSVEDLPSADDFRYLWADVQIALGRTNAQDQRLEEYVRNFRQFRSFGKLSDRSFVQLWYFAGALDLVRGGQMTESSAAGGVGHFDCFGYVAPTHEAHRDVSHKLTRLRIDAHVTGP